MSSVNLPTELFDDENERSDNDKHKQSFIYMKCKKNVFL